MTLRKDTVAQRQLANQGASHRATPKPPQVFRPQPVPKCLQMKANTNGQARAVVNNRPNVKPAALHVQPMASRVLSRNDAANRQPAIKPASVQLQTTPRVLQTKVSRNPVITPSRTNVKITSPHVQPSVSRSHSIRPQSQVTPRVVQRHPVKPVAPHGGARQTVQLSMSRVIQRKGRYFIEGKEVPRTTQLTDGRVWSEDRNGDFHATWPLASYCSPHDKRMVPTAQSYAELGLDPSGFDPPRCVGQRMIVVGIPYRDDAFGISLRKDAMLVRFGTGCSVRILHGPPTKFGEKVDALYIPGAPYDLPETRLVTEKQAPKSKPQEIEWGHRLALQEAWLKWADENNKPVLGICGGSRRLAQFSGGGTAHMSQKAQRFHRGNFQEPNLIKHQVIIEGESQLGRLLLSGNYRALGPDVERGLAELVHSGAVTFKHGKIILDVNSMHWAQSVFPRTATNISLSAYAHEDPDHTLEGWSRVDRPFWIGVQWHPEYAQTGMGQFRGKSKPHANIMKGLGQAATEDYAIRVLQSAIRTALAQRELRSRIPQVEEEPTVTTTTSSPSLGSPLRSLSLLSPVPRRSLRRVESEGSDDEYVTPLRPPSAVRVIDWPPPQRRIVNEAPITARQLEVIYGTGQGIWEFNG